MKRVHLCASLALALAGCAGTMSGLDGPGRFSCQAPDGITCASLSGVYANALQNHLPGQAGSIGAARVEHAAGSIQRAVPTFGEPLRSAQKVRRVWLAPWEDEDEVLHDQSYLYLVVDPGRWQVEHARRQAGEGYRPVRPPATFAPALPQSGDRPALRMERVPPAHGALPAAPLPGRDLLPPAGEGEP